MTNTATTRQLEIQNGVLKRYCYKHTLLVDTTLNQERTMKDLSAYQQEYADIKEQIQSASQDQPVKQWQQVLEETERMVADSYKRLSEAVETLQTLMESPLRGTKQWEQSEALLKDAKQLLLQNSFQV